VEEKMDSFFRALERWGSAIGGEQSLVAVALLRRREKVEEWIKEQGRKQDRDMKDKNIWIEDMKNLFHDFGFGRFPITCAEHLGPGIVLAGAIDTEYLCHQEEKVR